MAKVTGRSVNRFAGLFIAVALLAASLPGTVGSASAKGDSGAVYTLTNAASGNAVAVFDRQSDGALVPAGTVPTGGLGTGSGLGSQGALVLSDNGRWLFAVNAGSNDISVFEVGGHGLALADRAPSGGVRPISLTNRGNLLYVLNAGVPNNITGFRVGRNGTLTQIPSSSAPLSGADVGPAQVEFSPGGEMLVVTEKNTNKIDTFAVGRDGTLEGPNVQVSSGVTPFGFEFDKRGHLIVSEAFGGAVNGSAASSYGLKDNGALQTISASVPTNQTAACWVAVSKDGRYAYTTNAGSGSVSGYSIGRNGNLTLLDADGRTGVTGDGSSPIDAAFSNNGRFLYVLTSGAHAIFGFQIGPDGSLSPLGSAGGLVPGTVGLAVR